MSSLKQAQAAKANAADAAGGRVNTIWLTARYVTVCRCGARVMQGDTILYDRDLKMPVRCPTCHPPRLSPGEAHRYQRLMHQQGRARLAGDLDEELAARAALRPLIDKLMEGRI